jgi:hypothetical protein
MATANSWVQDPGTTWTTSLPPPPTATQRPPAHLIVELVQGGVGGLLAVHGEHPVGQRIEASGR